MTHSGDIRADRLWRNGALGLLLLILAVLGISFPFFPRLLPHIFFEAQDIYILVLQLLLLVGLWRMGTGESRAGRPLAGHRVWWAVWLAILCAAAFGAIGHILIFQGYSLTADEQSADLGAMAIHHGGLGYPVPTALQPYAKAMMPHYVSVAGDGHYWISDYLPVNSALRALLPASLRLLCSPLLVAVGLAALWRIGARIFAGRPDARIAAFALAATSSQLLVTSMTSYAMTAHFAFNMIWLMLVMRRDAWGHAGALAVAFLATGLHEPQFHPMFAVGFIIWFWIRGDRNLALLYAAAYAVILSFWLVLYPHLLDAWYGMPPARIARANLFDAVMGKVHRLRDLEPLLSLSRFAAWQNMLTLPLAFAGMAGAVRVRHDRDDLRFPLSLVCLIGLVSMVYQAHGWGYRYLHGDIGAFCLLAGYGWRRLGVGKQESGSAPPSLRPLWLASTATLILLLPLQCAMARAWTSPYVRLYRDIRAAPADVVLVDDVGAAFLQDLAHPPPDGSTRPAIMALASLTPRQLDRLCGRYPRIGFVDASRAHALGVSPFRNGPAEIRHAASMRRHLTEIGCAGFGQGVHVEPAG